MQRQIYSPVEHCCSLRVEHCCSYDVEHLSSHSGSEKHSALVLLSISAQKSKKWETFSFEDEMLLCGRADEVAALATSPCSKRIGDGEDGGDQEESKDRHLGDNISCFYGQ